MPGTIKTINMKIERTIILLVVMCASLSYCLPVVKEETKNTLDELVYSNSEEDVMWDPTATTFFQKVLDGDIAYFTDKMQYGHDQPSIEVEPTEAPSETIAKRAATKDRRFLWPDGIVYYNISHRYTTEERNTIKSALCQWEEKTCIRFVQRTTEKHYITIYPGGGCSSYIGRVGNNQGVSVGRSCFSLHSALHEIGHAIGFFHEQSRPDRDDYVDINYENILPGAANQFKKLTDNDVDSLGIGYDYNSIMHYDHNLFANSRELSTIVAKDPSIPVGGARSISELDAIQTRLLYQCPEVDPPRVTRCPVVEPTPPTPIPQPPYPSCGGIIDITEDQWDKVVTIESPNYPTYTHNVDCGWYVRVPEGFQIMVTVQPMSIDRSSRCQEDYIEMFESFGTSGYHLGKHCGTYNTPYRIGTYTKIGYIHYHTGPSNVRTGLNGFRATVEALDVDECRYGLCSNSCKNLPGGYECSCPPGYFLSSDGHTCFDTQECALGKGGCDHECVNSGGSYHCVCEEGYTLQADGKSCRSGEEPVDPCEEINCAHKCNEGQCSCHEGYELKADRKTCEDIDECASRNGGCSHTCTNTYGSFECSCPGGYRLTSDGKTCEDINECASENGGCSHTCINGIGSFECSCPEGYSLVSDGKTCRDINECASENGGCSHTCTNTDGSFECSCHQGYKLSSNGKACEDIDECSQGNPCSQLCTNTEGSFQCSCREDHKLQNDGITCLQILQPTQEPSASPAPTLPENVILLTGKTGEIKTERWPSETYPVNVDRDWLIRCPSIHQRIELNFDYRPFGLAGALPDCVKDWIKVYDGDSLDDELLGKFCHYATPSVRRSSSHKLRVIFHAGPTHNAARMGFKVTYTCIDVAPPPTPSVPTSPATTPTTATPSVTPSTVAPSSETPSTPTPSVAPSTLAPSTETPTLALPDDVVLLTGKTGEIKTERWPSVTYPVNVDRDWLIRCPSIHQRIELNFDYRPFGIAGALPDCVKDWIKVYDGDSFEDELLGKFCHYAIPSVRRSSSHQLRVIFHAGPTHNAARKGFKATYTCIDVAPPPTPSVTPSTVPPSSEAPTKPEVQTTTTEDEISKIPIPACGAILTDSSGSFNSPNWPETYPTNVKCEWIIVLPNKEKNVQITFNDGFGIAGRLPECTKDWVKIYNGYDDDTVASGPHCYYTEPETFVSSSHIAKVVLYAGPAHNSARRGFSASYRSV